MGVVIKKLSNKGWFTTRNRLGDRTLAQQLEGLDRLLEAAPGKSVLDIGCAEGLIGTHLVDKGAIAVHGIEVVDGHVKVANKLRKDRPCAFEVGDANNWVPRRTYDIVLMLGVLHKLKDPNAAVRRYAEVARELVVIRMPAKGWVIEDKRSEHVPYDILATMLDAGWGLVERTFGPFEEPVGYFVRS